MPDLNNDDEWAAFQAALVMVSEAYPITFRVVTITNEAGDILGRYVTHGMVL